MTIGEIKILSFLKTSQRENDIDVDIAAAISLTISEVRHFASKLEQSKLIIDVSNDYQNNLKVKSWTITNEGILKLKEIEAVPKKEKLDKISKADGTFICRPFKQDITPKAFEINPVSMIAAFETPTERRMLWIISHYPYLLNMFFMHDLGGGKEENYKSDSKMGEALKVMHSLKLKHFIKQSDDLLTYSITLKGQLYRLTTHPQWIFIQLLLAALLALIVGIIIKRW
jgi:hypothetical protein